MNNDYWVKRHSNLLDETDSIITSRYDKAVKAIYKKLVRDIIKVYNKIGTEPTLDKLYRLNEY